MPLIISRDIRQHYRDVEEDSDTAQLVLSIAMWIPAVTFRITLLHTLRAIHANLDPLPVTTIDA